MADGPESVAVMAANQNRMFGFIVTFLVTPTLPAFDTSVLKLLRNEKVG